MFNKYILKYIKNFSNKKNGSKNALIVVDKDYNSKNTLKLLDLILNEKNYTKIVINELEVNKSDTLVKVKEATQSQRLSTMSEKLKDKCKILKQISNSNMNSNRNLLVNAGDNNYISSCNMLFNENIIVQDSQPFLMSYSTQADNHIPMFLQENPFNKTLNSSNTNSITDFNSMNELNTNNTLLNVISNIQKKTLDSKTIITIIDNFDNIDDNKGFLNALTNTISNTKCPIIIFTSKNYF